MNTPLTVELVVEVMRDLHSAFPGKMDDAALVRRAHVYRDNLNGISGDALRWAAKQVIREDNFFPKIARLRQLAQRWQQHNQPPSATAGAGDTCRNGHPFRWEKRWRPKRTHEGWGVLRLSDDRQWLLLEQYSRSLCECDAKCAYWPELGAPTNEPSMRVLNAKGGPNVPEAILREIKENRRPPRNIPETLVEKPASRPAA